MTTHAVRATLERADRDEAHEDHPDCEAGDEPKVWHASTLPGGRSLRMTFASCLFFCICDNFLFCDNFVVSCDDNVMRVDVQYANLPAW